MKPILLTSPTDLRSVLVQTWETINDLYTRWFYSILKQKIVLENRGP